jgi:hypothetical protein
MRNIAQHVKLTGYGSDGTRLVALAEAVALLEQERDDVAKLAAEAWRKWQRAEADLLRCQQALAQVVEEMRSPPRMATASELEQWADTLSRLTASHPEES